MNVHKMLGNGFQEVIYQRALEIGFSRFFNMVACIGQPALPLGPCLP
jgi:hypothetical protein